MPAFRLLVDRDASLPFHHLGPRHLAEGLDIIDFDLEDLARLKSLRAAVLQCNQAHKTCVLVPRRKWKAVFFDMDSTVIAQESIVELARAADKAAEVAAITERAMAGELDFAAALRARVAMLAGISESVFATVAPRLQINPGMHRFAQIAHEQGIKLYLVSGGFTPLAAGIARELGFTAYLANGLALEKGYLTGGLEGPLIDAAAKADFLRRTCKSLGIAPEEVIAVGDGANDLPMLELAGGSIGYQPKPILLPHIHGANYHDHSLLIPLILSV